MALISSKGILGIKWLYIIAAAAAFFFRKPIMAFLKPWIDKAKSAANPSPNTQNTAS